MKKRCFVDTVQQKMQALISLFVVLCFLTIVSWGECASSPKAGKNTPVTPQYGGVLRIIGGGTIVNLGIPSEANNPGDIIYSNPAVETLLNLDEVGNPVPWLATGWTIAKDGKSITFTLRKGVKFHDGTDFNAEAVKYVLDLFRNGTKAELKAVSSIDVLDDFTVRLNLSEFQNHILNSLTVTAGMMVSPTALKTHEKTWAMLNPVGTGPFKLVRHERDTRLTYEKFPGYWQKGKPYLNGVEFIFIADPVTALMSFKAGEGDVIIRVDPKDSIDLQTTGKYAIGKVPIGIFGLAPDGGNPKSPFADIRVRRAVEYAINKGQITKELFYGVWEAATQAADPGGVTYNPTIKGYPYNPKKARELLAQAGYPEGFKTKIIYRPLDSQNYMVSIQKYLKDVGIDAELEAVTPAKFSQIINTGWENALVAWNLPCGKGTEPGQNALRAFTGNFFKSIIRPSAFEDVIHKAVSERDIKKRSALYKTMTKMITDDYATICPIYVGSAISVKTIRTHDIRIMETWPMKWSPQDAWLSK